MMNLEGFAIVVEAATLTRPIVAAEDSLPLLLKLAGLADFGAFAF